MFLCFCFFLGQDTADDLLWLCESVIIRIDHNLSQYSGNRFVNTSGKQLCTDGSLKVVTDVALAHGRTYGHRCKCIIRMCLTEFVHSSMDHSDLWSVTV